MVRAEGLLPNRQRALVERLSLREMALAEEQVREAVQARAHIGMIRTEGLFPDRQRPLIERSACAYWPEPGIAPRGCSAGWPHRMIRAEAFSRIASERL